MEHTCTCSSAHTSICCELLACVCHATLATLGFCSNMDLSIRSALSEHGIEYAQRLSPCPPFRWILTRQTFLLAIESASVSIGEPKSGIASVRARAQRHLDQSSVRTAFHIGDMYTVLCLFFCEHGTLPIHQRLKQFDGLIVSSRHRTHSEHPVHHG